MTKFSSFSKKMNSREKICSGELFEDTLSGILVSSDLDKFCLHDSLLYRYEFINDKDAGADLSISGLMPDFANMFEINFRGIDFFDSYKFKFTDFFSIRELKIAIPHKRTATFFGEFEGQFFSFSFATAHFIKYKINDPISRSDLGW